MTDVSTSLRRPSDRHGQCGQRHGRTVNLAPQSQLLLTIAHVYKLYLLTNTAERWRGVGRPDTAAGSRDVTTARHSYAEPASCSLSENWATNESITESLDLEIES